VKRAILSESYVKHLTQYPGPILFINGENDYRKEEQMWVKAAQNARLEVISGASGWVLIDIRFYRTVNSLVRKFIEEVLHGEEEEEQKRLALIEQREEGSSAQGQTNKPPEQSTSSTPDTEMFAGTNWLFENKS